MGKDLVEEYAFLTKVCDMLKEVESAENEAMEAAAQAAYEAIRAGGLLHVFATGHSHMIADELFFRAGGLVPVNPILEPSLTLDAGAIGSMRNERKAGLAEEVLRKEGVRQGDILLISSNSGINNVPVEAAIYAKKAGLTVVGITSLKASKELISRHAGGKKLYEVCDIVIDNHAPVGDGLLTLSENGLVTGGASTFGSLFIAQRIVLKIENRFLSDQKTPPVYMSANIPGGTEYNEKLIQEYKGRIKYLN